MSAKPRSAKKSKSTWPLPMAAPEKVGLSPQRLERIATVMERFVGQGTIAGAITLIARKGRIAHLQCFGMMDVASRTPMREDALFRMYSMTKPVTCVAVLALYEECAFALEHPVKRYLPEFADLKVKVVRADGTTELVPAKRDVTIHDLLTHTGGLTYDGFYESTAEGLDLPEFVSRVAKMPLAAHPGEKWIYSNSNDVLGRLVEVISGKSLPAFMKERIFDPLGMEDTGFQVAKEDLARFTTLYTHDANGRIVPKKAEDRPYTTTPKLYSGGAGLVGTTSDYLRFALMLLGNGMFDGTRILSRKTVELMRQDHLPAGHPCIEPYKFGYGYGVSVVRSLAEKQGIASVGQFGWGGAATTNTWIDPQEDMISMVMTQLRPQKGISVDHTIKVAFYQAIDD